AAIQGNPSPLPELATQYTDYARWQLEQFESGAWASHLDFWKKQLQDVTPVLRLKTDFARPDMQTYRGAREFLQLSRDVMESVGRLGRSARCTPYMVLLGVFELLLARWSGQKDFVVGSPVANRNRPDVEALIGSFMNTLAIRSDLSNATTFNDLLG